jgi:tetratricopeptide (TPR) repeat protein
MKLRMLRSSGHLLMTSALLLAGTLPATAQQKARSKPIDIDRELQPKLPESRALSYYHYSLSKWQEQGGDLVAAVNEMRKAVDYYDASSQAHVGLATLLFKAGDYKEAIAEAQEASQRDRQDPEPHWISAQVYFKEQDGQDQAGRNQLMEKAVEELEAMRALAPDDERALFALGHAYMELGRDEKAVDAFEKYQSLQPDSTAGYIEIARIYEAQNKLDKAAEFLTRAADGQPDNVETLMMLAGLQAKQNKNKEAAETYRKILSLTGDNAIVKKQLASSLLDAGNYADAAKLLDEMKPASSKDKDLQVLLGRARLGTQQFPEAIKLFQSVLNDNPDSLEAEFYLGIAQEQSGDTQSAIKVFSDLVNKSAHGEEFEANRAVFQQHLAAAYGDAGENDKAIAVYEDMAKAENPPKPQTMFQLINAYRLNHQLDKALALGKKEYEDNPNLPEIGLVYARTLADAGKAKEGAEVLNKMLQADPSNVDIYVNLSQVYVQGKRFADAEKVLLRAQEKNLDKEKLRFQLASVYERQKDFDRAESVFKELLKENPKNATVLNYIGYMLADRGVRLQEAVQYVEEALRIEPNKGEYLDSLGWALYKMNDLSNAEKYLLQAVGLVKNDSTIQDHLGDLYFKTGDLQKAADYWNMSLKNGTELDETQKIREKLDKVQDTLRKQKRR